MTLRFRVGYNFTDYNGEIAQNGFTIVGVSNVQALDAFVLQAEPIIAALSSGVIVDALAYAKMPPYVDKPLSGLTPITTRLLCLYTNGVMFGSLLIPCARQLAMSGVGAFGNWRLLPGTSQAAQDITALGDELRNTLLPSGEAWPDWNTWRAAYTNYRQA